MLWYISKKKKIFTLKTKNVNDQYFVYVDGFFLTKIKIIFKLQTKPQKFKYFFFWQPYTTLKGGVILIFPNSFQIFFMFTFSIYLMCDILLNKHRLRDLGKNLETLKLILVVYDGCLLYFGIFANLV